MVRRAICSKIEGIKMTNITQLKLLQLCKGKTIAQALHRLEIAQHIVSTNKVANKIRVCGAVR